MSGEIKLTEQQLQRIVEAATKSAIQSQPQRATFTRSASGLLPATSDNGELTPQRKFRYSVALIAADTVLYSGAFFSLFSLFGSPDNAFMYAAGALSSGTGALLLTEFSAKWIRENWRENNEVDETEFFDEPEAPVIERPAPQRDTPPMPRPQRRKTLRVNGKEIEIDESKVAKVNGAEIKLWRVQKWAAIISPPNCNTKANVTHIKAAVGVGYTNAKILHDWLANSHGIDDGYLTDTGIDMLWQLCGFEPLPYPEQPAPSRILQR